jgi:hypothetical protein
MAYNTYPQVADILASVSQDVRQQLSSTAAPGQSILMDYINRVHKRVLRYSRWTFLLSQPQYFKTVKSQSLYWLGPSDQCPKGVVDTGLNLKDLDKIKKDSVLDISNIRQLKWLSTPPYGPQLQDTTGMGRNGLPATWLQDPNNPNELQIYPPPNNANPSTPTIPNPIVQSVSGGSLTARTYYVKITFVDSLGGESASTANGTEQWIALDNLAIIRTPYIAFNTTDIGVKYASYNVYASVTEGSETLQTVTPIAIGTDWTEPTTGLTTTGASVPTANTLAQFGAYLIKFQYYKNRIDLTSVEDFLQVPTDYFDVIIHGVNAYGWNLIGKPQESQQSFALFNSGLREMIWDKNLFPEGVEFIRPDAQTYVNNQILGYLPPFF